MISRPPILLACLLAVVACKTDVTGVDSGVAASKQGKDLTPDEQESLCEAVFTYLSSRVEGDEKEWECRGNAVINATFFSADCQEYYDRCLAEPEDAPEPCSFGPLDWTECTATIAEIEACYTEYQDANAAIRNDLSCDRLAEYEQHRPFDDYRHSERCEAAIAKCPGLLPPDADDPL